MVDIAAEVIFKDVDLGQNQRIPTKKLTRGNRYRKMIILYTIYAEIKDFKVLFLLM